RQAGMMIITHQCLINETHGPICGCSRARRRSDPPRRRLGHPSNRVPCPRVPGPAEADHYEASDDVIPSAPASVEAKWASVYKDDAMTRVICERATPDRGRRPSRLSKVVNPPSPELRDASRGAERDLLSEHVRAVV